MIKLTQGRIALVDDEDFEELNKFRWYANKMGGKFYAVRRDTKEGKSLMHRVILNEPHGLVVDHINGNTLDNRKVNLRPATKQQNCSNRRHPQKNNKLGVKGVCWDKKKKKYRAYIRPNGKQIHLGLFALLQVAVKAHRDAEVKLYGDFARQVENPYED